MTVRATRVPRDHRRRAGGDPRGVRSARATSRPSWNARPTSGAGPRRSRPTGSTSPTYPFVTLDPAGATDLDQAFALEQDGRRRSCCATPSPTSAGSSRPGRPLDHEAWRRGVTVYLPDGKASRLSDGPLGGGRQPAARRSPAGDRAHGRRRPRRARPTLASAATGTRSEPGQARLRDGDGRSAAAAARRVVAHGSTAAEDRRGAEPGRVPRAGGGPEDARRRVPARVPGPT